MALDNASVEFNSKLKLTQEEFQEVFNNGDFTKDYHAELKKQIANKLNYEINIKKKFNGKNTITIHFVCRSANCSSPGNISVKKIDIHDLEVALSFKATCLHLEGKILF